MGQAFTRVATLRASGITKPLRVLQFVLVVSELIADTVKTPGLKAVVDRSGAHALVNPAKPKPEGRRSMKMAEVPNSSVKVRRLNAGDQAQLS